MSLVVVVGGLEGDLLGFDTMVFGSAGAAPEIIDTQVAAVQSAVSPGANNPINNAFDDLLGLEMPEPIESSVTMVQTAQATMPEEMVPKKSKAKKEKKEKKEKKKSKKKSA